MNLDVTQAELVLLLHAAIGSGTALHALLNVRDPRSAWGWIAACMLAPVAGSLLYVLLGHDRIRSLARRASSRSAADAIREESAAPKAVPPDASDLEQRELARLGTALSHRELLDGNQLTLLRNGEAAFPPMLDAIRTCRRRLWLSSYIFSGDGVGERFIEALVAAHQRGVDVRVLVDAIGDLYYWPRASRRLKARGVSVRRFQLPGRLMRVPQFNLRNHRKLLIADEALAFTGGMNIGDHQFTSSARGTEDLHFRLQGPVARQLAHVFASDWELSGGPSLPVEHGPAAPPTEGGACRTITEGPSDELDRLELLLLGVLASAHRRVCIMTPYFIPTAELARALESAALRGIRVELMLPKRSNLPWVDWASHRWLEPLIARGVHILLRPPPFAHSKLLVMDDYYGVIGSANLDPRSLRLNFELVVEIYCRSFAGELNAHFDEIRPLCHELTSADFACRSFPQRARDAFFWLFSAYL